MNPSEIDARCLSVVEHIGGPIHEGAVSSFVAAQIGDPSPDGRPFAVRDDVRAALRRLVDIGLVHHGDLGWENVFYPSRHVRRRPRRMASPAPMTQAEVDHLFAVALKELDGE